MSPFTAYQACVLNEAGGFVMTDSDGRSLEEGRARVDQGSLGRFPGQSGDCQPAGHVAEGPQGLDSLRRPLCYPDLSAGDH